MDAFFENMVVWNSSSLKNLPQTNQNLPKPTESTQDAKFAA